MPRTRRPSRRSTSASRARSRSRRSASIARPSRTRSMAARTHIATEPVKSQAEGTAVAQALLDRLANAYIAAEGVDAPATRRSGPGAKRQGQRRRTRSSAARTGDAAPPTSCAAAAPTRPRSPTRPTHTLLAATGSGRPRRGSRASARQLVLGVVTNNQDPENMGRVRVRYPALWRGRGGNVGANRDAQRRQRAGHADAAGRRRGGADRVRARRHDATLRAGLAVQRTGHARRRPAARHRTARSRCAATSRSMARVQGGPTSLTSGGKLRESGSVTDNVTITGPGADRPRGSATLTLKCGDTQIQLSSAGVQISGPMITLG